MNKILKSDTIFIKKKIAINKILFLHENFLQN